MSIVLTLFCFYCSYIVIDYVEKDLGFCRRVCNRRRLVAERTDVAVDCRSCQLGFVCLSSQPYCNSFISSGTRCYGIFPQEVIFLPMDYYATGCRASTFLRCCADGSDGTYTAGFVNSRPYRPVGDKQDALVLALCLVVSLDVCHCRRDSHSADYSAC